ncbi:MAG: hypothetical protein HN417_02160, partial [Desulfobacula sp.]|nr:hypothetical protein [Desulfobacula sp.]
MKKVIGGLIAIILGLFCFSVFFSAFLNLLAGIIPLTLLLGGCLTIYLKHEDESHECGEATTDCCNNSTKTDTPLPTIPLKTASTETKPEKAEPKQIETKLVETKSTETETIENVIDKPIDATPLLHGNTNSHVFHNPDCKFSKSKKCTASFNTREEAIQ